MCRPMWVSNDAPSELEMRGSAESAASSARLAVSIFSAVSSASTSAEYSPRSPSMLPNSSGSGRPACGSSVVMSASSIGGLHQMLDALARRGRRCRTTRCACRAGCAVRRRASRLLSGFPLRACARWRRTPRLRRWCTPRRSRRRLARASRCPARVPADGFGSLLPGYRGSDILALALTPCLPRSSGRS